MKNAPGTVYLVGAGPGDAGLLTLRAAELLGRADVVVYDALVSPEIMRLAPAGAERIYAGKRAAQHAIPQADLNLLLVEKAQAGKTVVRLKGGDPYVFGRGGEEAQELASAGVPFEVVPGISSVVAGPNYAGIPLTHRDFCSSFTVLTGHEDPTKPGTALDYELLAKLPGTKVVLMGVERIRIISQELVRHGLDPKTPAAMIRWATTGRQQTLVATIATIADEAEKANFAAPALTIIGGVVGLREELNWFEKRKLFGRRIVVTRTREQASQLSQQLSELGADVLEIPTIKITAPQNLMPLVESITGLGEYDWLIFTSPNGVTAFFDYFFKAYTDLREIGPIRIAAVGPTTAAKIKEFHLTVDAVPQRYVATEVISAIAAAETLENLRCLLVRAEVANADLPRLLEEKGAIVDDVACYRTIKETEDLDGSSARLEESGADWITFTSSSTVENFHARFDLPALLGRFPQMKTVSIGPETTKALVTLGLTPTVEAKEHNIPGLIQALVKAETTRKR
ncbi:MAG TPA: uroporphyrinogen-III C-methyltransferase [Candidatus Limnocylindria bacterium]|jgi:uroporphyrinogen III methyltransferase/synthase|nr:uroporphyrinogen-III C-methyltransferase [Candidatus Limnocylindria bacterium]